MSPESETITLLEKNLGGNDEEDDDLDNGRKKIKQDDNAKEEEEQQGRRTPRGEEDEWALFRPSEAQT